MTNAWDIYVDGLRNAHAMEIQARERLNGATIRTLG